MSSLVDDFIGASLWHGRIDRARELLAMHPEVASTNVYTAAVVGDDAAISRFVAEDPSSAVARGGPREWDALTYLCFSKFLRDDRERAEQFARAARALLRAGANANTGFFDENHRPKPEWESALYGAAGVAFSEGVTRVLLEYGADPNDGEVPYHSPESYDLGALRALVESGRLSPASLTTMLLRKADWHDHDGVVYLLEHGADPNAGSVWGITPLQQALRRDNALSIIEAIVDAGGDPLLPGADGRPSALQLAARRGRTDVLIALRDRGIPMRLEGADRLAAACALDELPTIRALAASDPTSLDALLTQGATLLADFARNDNAAGAAHLLALGVPVDARYPGDAYYGTPPGGTALHVAAWHLRPDVVRLLLDRGADPNARDGGGLTPLTYAVRACVDSYWRGRRTAAVADALVAAGATTDGITYPSGYVDVDRVLERAGR